MLPPSLLFLQWNEFEGNEDVETTIGFFPTKTNITFGKYREDDPATRTSDEKIIKALADENAALKEKTEIQRKLIETYEAERQAISQCGSRPDHQ